MPCCDVLAAFVLFNLLGIMYPAVPKLLPTADPFKPTPCVILPQDCVSLKCRLGEKCHGEGRECDIYHRACIDKFMRSHCRLIDM